MEFAIHLEEFLIDIENQKIVNKYALNFMNQLLNYIPIAIESVPLLISIIRILSKVNAISPIVIKPKEIVPLFIAIFDSANSFLNTIEENKSIFEYFFCNEQFFQMFTSKNGLVLLLQTAFLKDVSTQRLGKFVNNLLFKVIPISNYQNASFQQLFAEIAKVEDVNDLLKHEFCIFVSHVFSVMTHFVKNATNLFVDNGILAKFDKWVDEIKERNHSHYYKYLVNSRNDDLSNPPNSIMIQHIYKRYQTNSADHTDYFDLILEFVVSDPQSVSKINSSTPFINWFTMGHPPISQLISLLSALNNIEPDLVRSCIPLLFSSLITNKAKSSDYHVMIDILDTQLKSNRITAEFLLESGFLTVFFIDASTESLFALLTEHHKFKPIAINVYKLQNAISYQSAVFKSILDLFEYFTGEKPNQNEQTLDETNNNIQSDENQNSDHQNNETQNNQQNIIEQKCENERCDVEKYAKIVNKFLSKAPSPIIISFLMDKINQTKSLELFQLLPNLFSTSKESSQSFIKENGLNWLFEIYNENLINIEQVAEILSKLVQFQSFIEIDILIASLPKEHPLFKLPPETLYKIVYGDSPKFPVIRSASMLPYIPPIGKLDPYNAWLLGFSFVDLFKDNIYEMPMLDSIMNRIVQHDIVEKLLERPEMLYKFVDLKYDHFPLFQFFPGEEELIFSKNFIGISFWLKLSSEIDEQETIFKTNNLTISLKANTISISCENLMETTEINVCEWNHVTIKLKLSLMVHEIKVYINNKVFQFTTKLQTFSTASFSHKNKCLLFLGATIRFFAHTSGNDNAHVKTLYEKGVGFMERFVPDEEVITSYCLIGSNNTNNSNFPKYSDNQRNLSRNNSINNFHRTSNLNNNITDSKITVPDNCFNVPYFGFALHFCSLKKFSILLELLVNSENSLIYDSLFNTILNIQTIDYNSEFFTQILISMKKSSKFLTKDHFISLFKTIHATASEIPLILYDKELWRQISNEIIIQSLFEYFSPIVDWQIFENIDLFLATVVFDNSSSKIIVKTLLNSHQKLPKFVKYLIAILKIAPTLRQANCTWDAVEFREETPIQHTILDCLCEFVSLATIDMIVSLLPFEDLKSLMIVSPKSIAAKTFHLICVIGKLSPNYIPQNDGLFLSITATLSNYESVWDDVINLRPHNFPLYLIFIWAGSICLIHQNTYGIQPTPHMEYIEESLNKLLAESSSSNNISQILNNELCVSIILSWFPFILHYTVLFQAFPEKETNISKPFEPLTMAQFPEAFDNAWLGTDQVLSEIAFPMPLPASKPSQFMLEKVSLILTSNGFQVPFPPITSTTKVSEWLTKSPLLPFITDLILQSPPANLTKLLYSFFFEFVFGSPQHVDPLTPIFVHSIINRLADCFSLTFSTTQTLQFLHVLTGLQALQESSLIIISDLLTLATLIQTKHGQSILNKYTGLIEPIILSLFSSLSISHYQNIFYLFSNHVQMFATLILSEKSLLTWLYVFFIASHHEKKHLNLFLKKLLPYLKLDRSNSQLLEKIMNKSIEKDMKSLSLIEGAWKQKSNDFQTTFKQLYSSIKDTKSTFPVEIGMLSYEITQFQFRSNAKHFLLSRLFSQTLKYLCTSFLIQQESNQWNRFTHSLLNNTKCTFNTNLCHESDQNLKTNFAKDESKDINKDENQNENKKTKKKPLQVEHLAPFFHPLAIPKMLTPSPYPFIDIGNDVNIRSIPIKLYKQNLMYSYSVSSDIKPSIIKMFNECNANLGQPLLITNCILSRYYGNIPSVLFLFNDYIKIIADCQLTSNGEDIDFQTSLKTALNHFFIESVFIGHWGKTEMFASKIVISFRPLDIINIRQLNDSCLIFNTYTCGNFMVSLTKKDNVMKLMKLKENNFQIKKVVTIQKFCNGELSALDFLIRMNNKKSFISIENYPIAPNLLKENHQHHFDEIKLTKLTPLSYFPKNVQFDGDSIPLSFYGCFDFFNDPSEFFYLRNELEKNETKKLIATFISEKVNHNQLIEIKSEPQTNVNIGFVNVFKPKKCHQMTTNKKLGYFAKDKIILVPKLSQLCLDQFTVTINSIELRITSKKGNTLYLTTVNPHFAYATNLKVSSNGLFIVVDTYLCISEAYQVFYKDGKPFEIEHKSTMPFSGYPQSEISGDYWVSISAENNKIILWNIFSKMIYRKIRINHLKCANYNTSNNNTNPDNANSATNTSSVNASKSFYMDNKDKIEAISYDDKFDIIWVATSKILIVITSSGKVLGSYPRSNKSEITAMKAVPLPNSQVGRVVLFGNKDGRIYFGKLDFIEKTIEFKEMAKLHDCKIIQFDVNKEMNKFLSVDCKGSVYLWQI
ncbi:hypothetical protein TRFO_04853 [Tritrichomonas foetus]|uniref:BEACH domain-containing protein n=1 Tax=Tritrichomonas foetus TaxID=1144522 RepID=A0A1J4KHC2_9EUKA|nr:hypothetical protein TRFO_04853 [Tritrichomonas foetus]|eukprot:OHT08741.1 hypothetical protein TRFO_04853 [Tritrichomonas foetus]